MEVSYGSDDFDLRATRNTDRTAGVRLGSAVCRTSPRSRHTRSNDRLRYGHREPGGIESECNYRFYIQIGKSGSRTHHSDWDHTARQASRGGAWARLQGLCRLSSSENWSSEPSEANSAASAVRDTHERRQQG